MECYSERTLSTLYTSDDLCGASVNGIDEISIDGPICTHAMVINVCVIKWQAAIEMYLF